MSSEDYLLRQLRQLGDFFARLLGYQEKGEHDRILQEVDAALDAWFQADVRSWDDRTEKKIQNLCSSATKNMEEEKVLAELLYYRLKSMDALGWRQQVKSLANRLHEQYMDIDRRSGEYSFEMQQRIAEIRQLARKE
ncbi:MAG TPA: hypothetical protein PLK12_16155 [Prolixibacteraceae bacterium]|nr:hypothetical protein [Prolixibacteraceae bacterium]